MKTNKARKGRGGSVLASYTEFMKVSDSLEQSE